MAQDVPDHDAVLEDIQALSERPSPPLDRVERTLTDGYARALEIESQRLRLRRELEERAGQLGQASQVAHVEEVAGLAQGIQQADHALVKLRAALARLAAIAQQLRTA